MPQGSNLSIDREKQANYRHGLHAFTESGLHLCNKCVKRTQCPEFKKDADCTYLAAFQERVVKDVMALDYVDEQDRPLAKMLAKQMSILALCEMYFTEEDMIIHDKKTKRLEAQPLVVTYTATLRSVLQTMTSLGLSPAARARIDHEKASVGGKLVAIGGDGANAGTTSS